MKIFKRERTEERIKRTKRQEIEHLRKVRAEFRDDAAWHFMQGNCEGCIQSTMMAAGVNQKLIQRRRRLA